MQRTGLPLSANLSGPIKYLYIEMPFEIASSETTGLYNNYIRKVRSTLHMLRTQVIGLLIITG
jgi:hypothetical protein